MHFDMTDHRRLLRAAGAALALGVVMAPAAAKACNPFEFLFGGCRESVRPRPIETIPVEGPIAKPKIIVRVPEIPKTRSGKILRRLLAQLWEGDELGDTTSLQNPWAVEGVREAVRQVQEKETT